MKIKPFYDYETRISFFHKINNLDDIFDIKRFTNIDFFTLARLLDINYVKGKVLTPERKARLICKKIFVDCLKMITKDMIYENDCFIFPVRQFGYMDIRNISNKDMPYNIETNGKFYGIRLVIDKEIKNRNKKYYHVRLNKEFRKELYSEVLKNHKY